MTGATRNGRGRRPEDRTGYAVPALDKAAEVLELMADEPAGLSATDIAARLGRSMGEIYRIVVVLHRLGFLARDERLERYTLSLKLFELAHRHPPTDRLVRAALPVLESLARRTDQSVHLGALSREHLVILAQADSPQAMHYSVRIGSTFPALETSSGIVILAFGEPRLRIPFLDALAAEERGAIEARFAEARRLGYERHPSAVVHGVTNLSRPVFNHVGMPLAAITIPYLPQLRTRADMDAALAFVIEAADDLSRGLGWRPGVGEAEPDRLLKEQA